MSKISDDLQVLSCILNHCDRIERTIERFGDDKNIFISDRDYIDSVSMNILQIGELAGRLTSNFVDYSKERINWRAIRGMRNLFAHAYGTMDLDRIWDTAITDIPDLKAYCLAELGLDMGFSDSSETLSM